MQYGILGQQAPELMVNKWFSPGAEPTPPLTLESMGNAVKLIYCFQSWCPGCHSSGFPTLETIYQHFSKDAIDNGDLKMCVIQTVFEGHATNTEQSTLDTQKRYKLPLPFAHDAATPHPAVMTSFRTGGTPWIIIIDRNNRVIYNDFHIAPTDAINLINKALKKGV